MTSRLITADASKVTPAEFLQYVLGGKTQAERYAESLEKVIRLIEVGASLYGIPPLMVADARKLMAERAALTEQVADELKRTIELQQRKDAA